jgi:hypothetical protein
MVPTVIGRRLDEPRPHLLLSYLDPLRASWRTAALHAPCCTANQGTTVPARDPYWNQFFVKFKLLNRFVNKPREPAAAARPPLRRSAG